MSLLSLRGVTAAYGRVEVLHEIDLTVDEGSIVAILGPNGAGKTSLLRAISRTVSVRGSRSFDGTDLNRLRTAQIARLGIGHVPEGRGTFSDFTVEENLRLGSIGRPSARRSLAASDLQRVYRTFPILEEFRKRPAGALSGGQAQMLAVGRALLARPRLLLVDEPSLGLAPLTTKELFAQFVALRDEWELTILLAEQNARLSLEVADRVVLLSRGRVVHDGPAAEYHSTDALHAHYFGGSDDGARGTDTREVS
ncbi:MULTISPECIES: ABC transporter ATP-binding protein [unclassified Microbacterium]|uniref:ABC transporter ATP-binding protein n=1 Tax=unclassified Microbacterium TaxID=2609290 RepID=UPI000EA9AB54|nr:MULTISPECIES: ABC transporter ATP-binding protein [unclassified Microbacterium]MBT2486460.1 ABC transporter ATP-binding protein [Microbacterium sp. ISL-108]RKN69158.1 ABC transporter ATP-binding protein [Microbacterium sp. CGR2]